MAKITGVGKVLRGLRGLADRSRHMPVIGVSYNTRYAVYVHEDLTAYHSVGEARFLMRPARDNLRQIVAVVVSAMRSGDGWEASLLKGGRLLQSLSYPLVPVDTGLLRSSARTEVVRRS